MEKAIELLIIVLLFIVIFFAAFLIGGKFIHMFFGWFGL